MIITKRSMRCWVCVAPVVLLTACNEVSPIDQFSDPEAAVTAEQITISVLSGSHRLQGVPVCLDTNANNNCDDAEVTATTGNSGTAILDTSAFNDLRGLRVLGEVNIDEARYIDGSAGGTLARAEYRLLSSINRADSSVFLSPLSTYVTLTANANNLPVANALNEITARMKLSDVDDPTLVMGDYLDIEDSANNLRARLTSYSHNLANALKRVGLNRVATLDNITDSVSGSVAEGTPPERFFVFPVGNLADDNLLSYQLDDDGNPNLDSLDFTCQSIPANHAGVDIKTIDSDPLHAYQWHISGNGSWMDSNLDTSVFVPGSEINARQTYQSGYTGACVRVSVIDTPVSIEHPDLIANAVPLGSVQLSKTGEAAAGNITMDTFDPRPASWDNAPDFFAHGTSVAGIIAATSNNGKGGRGVAPGALIRSFSEPITFDLTAPPGAPGQPPMDSSAPPGENNEMPGANDDMPPGMENFHLNFVKEASRTMGDALFEPSLPQLSDVDVFNYSGSIYAENLRKPRNMPVVFRESMRLGTEDLRNGRGANYVVSSGNSYEPTNGYCFEYGRAMQGGEPVNLPCEITGGSEQQSSPYTISVGAHNASDEATVYSTPGPAVWLTAPSNDRLGPRSAPVKLWHGIVATDLEGCNAGFSASGAVSPGAMDFDNGLTDENPDCNYTADFGGTSASAPVVSGAIALLLEKHPGLNWRQVKYVLAKSARQLQPDMAPITLDVDGAPYTAIPGWTTNSAGYPFHYRFGFGGLDVDGAMAAADAIMAGNDPAGGALATSPFEEMPWVDAAVDAYANRVPDNAVTGLESTLSIAEQDGRVIESLQLSLDLTGTRLSDVSVELISPAGTKSILWSARSLHWRNEHEPIPSFVSQPDATLSTDDRIGRTIHLGDLREGSSPQFSDARWFSVDGTSSRQGHVLVSNHFFGEKSNGIWTLRVIDTDTGDRVFQDVVLDPITGSPQVDNEGNFVEAMYTARNPDERVLQGWSLKVFGHEPTS